MNLATAEARLENDTHLACGRRADRNARPQPPPGAETAPASGSGRRWEWRCWGGDQG